MPQPQRTKPIYTPPGGPPRVAKPDEAIIEAIGQEGVFRILSNVYTRLETASIRPMFADDLQVASRRAASFFVQVMGGQPMFTDNYGPPRMRQRHVLFEIDEPSRLEWLACFKAALRDDIEHHDFPEAYLDSMVTYLDEFSKWMVNVEPEA